MPRFRDGLTGAQNREFDTLGARDKRRFQKAYKEKLTKGGGNVGNERTYAAQLSPASFRTNASGFFNPSAAGGPDSA